MRSTSVGADRRARGRRSARMTALVWLCMPRYFRSNRCRKKTIPTLTLPLKGRGHTRYHRLRTPGHHPSPPREGEGTSSRDRRRSNQQRIHPLDISRRIIGQPAFCQQRLIKQDMREIPKQRVVRRRAFKFFHQRMFGVHLKNWLGFRRVLTGLFEHARELRGHAMILHDETGRRINEPRGDTHVFSLVLERFFQFFENRLERDGCIFRCLFLRLILQLAKSTAPLATDCMGVPSNSCR